MKSELNRAYDTQMQLGNALRERIAYCMETGINPDTDALAIVLKNEYDSHRINVLNPLEEADFIQTMKEWYDITFTSEMIAEMRAQGMEICSDTMPREKAYYWFKKKQEANNKKLTALGQILKNAIGSKIKLYKDKHGYIDTYHFGNKQEVDAVIMDAYLSHREHEYYSIDLIVEIDGKKVKVYQWLPC